MKAAPYPVLLLVCCTMFIAPNAHGQKPSSNYDYLEITLAYEHSFGGKKSVRLVQFLTDSCFYEYVPHIERGKDFWRRDELIKKDTIACSYFDSLKTAFHNIQQEDILLHNKNVMIYDGFMVKLTLSNGSSSIIYQLHTPRKKDGHIEDFKHAANLMLTLGGTTWEKWIK